jgi:YjbE family integral membrane protein
VHAIAGYFDPAWWRGWFDASVDQIGRTAFWLAASKIVFINIMLSGDNAVVIAMACRGLPPPQRLWGRVIGAGVAVVLLIAFTGMVAQLLLLPYLKLAGGFVLLLIAARLIVPEKADRNESEAVAHLWRAIWLIVTADVIMSLDNIIAIAAVANGNVLLLATGLIVSIPIILVGAALIAALIAHFPALIWIGAALLGSVAGETMATDLALANRLIAIFDEQVVQHIEFAATVSAALLAVAGGGLWRCLREQNTRATADA